MRTNTENFFAAMKQDGFPHESIIQMKNYFTENNLQLVTQSTIYKWAKKNEAFPFTFFRYFGEEVFYMSPISAKLLKKCLDERLEETIAHEKVLDENWERLKEENDGLHNRLALYDHNFCMLRENIRKLKEENEKLKEIIKVTVGDLVDTWCGNENNFKNNCKNNFTTVQ